MLHYSKVAYYLKLATSQKILKKLESYIGAKTLPDVLSENGTISLLNELNFSVQENGPMPIVNISPIDGADDAFIHFEVTYPNSEASNLTKVRASRVFGKSLEQVYTYLTIHDIPNRMHRIDKLEDEFNQSGSVSGRKNLRKRINRLKQDLRIIIDNNLDLKNQLFNTVPGLKDVYEERVDL